MDGNTPTQLHIDFRTRRPTAIDFFRPTADQRAACTALNRERTRGILEAAQLAPSRESFPVDVWNAIFARKSKQKGVPLIPLERQVAVIWLNSNGWLISDLHHRNIMRDREGNPTIIDALIGPVPATAQRKLAWLRNALGDAEDVRCGREPRKRMQFGDETDDDSL